MSDQGASILLYALMLILPLSVLISRRPPLDQTVKFALAWIAIFGFGLLIMQYRDRLPDVRRLLSDQQVVGEETRVRMNPDGHFYAEVTINGVERRMLIDSGATITADRQPPHGLPGSTPRAACSRLCCKRRMARSRRAEARRRPCKSDRSGRATWVW